MSDVVAQLKAASQADPAVLRPMIVDGSDRLLVDDELARQVLTQVLGALNGLQVTDSASQVLLTQIKNSLAATLSVAMVGTVDLSSATLAAIAAGAPSYVLAETPGGTIDGSNTQFSTLYSFRPATLRLYVNGLRQVESVHYVELGHTAIQFFDAPRPGDALSLDYTKL